jgi:hypothetical protein
MALLDVSVVNVARTVMSIVDDNAAFSRPTQRRRRSSDRRESRRNARDPRGSEKTAAQSTEESEAELRTNDDRRQQP